MVTWRMLGCMYVKHGLSTLPEYRCWSQIKQRCLNPNHSAYPNYGGRGIGVAPEWAASFEAFFADVGPRPSPQHSLDRIDNAKGYGPGNCRWTTWEEQARNRRPNGTAAGLSPPKTPGRKTNFKHGLIHVSEYKVWSAMKDRCLNPSSSNYPRWGGRGIKIHPAWIDDFPAFLADVGPRPTPQHTLDRVDNDGNYAPGNVRWATPQEQSANRRPMLTGSDHGNYTHGLTKTPEYKTWTSIKTRCFNQKHGRYADYGGRGITMCARWRESFQAFLADMGLKPSPEHTAQRLDHESHYSCGTCPECLERGWAANCRWGTKTEQNRARRPSERSGKLTEADVEIIHERLARGERGSVLAAEFGVGVSLIGKIRRREVWA